MFDTFRTRLGCEALEHRDTPAGNVAATFQNGVWYLLGDAADNQISVTKDASGYVTVTGLNGTTVNGQSSVFLGRLNTSSGSGWAPPRNGLYVDLGAGTDYLETHNVTAPSQNVEQFGGDRTGPVNQ